MMQLSPQSSQDEVMSEINMTPLVDIMLVLLIIFIITMPVLQHSIRVNLPQASTQAQPVQPTHINVSVNAQGEVFWNERAVSSEQLRDLARQASADANTQLHVRADKTTTYQHIASVMADIQNSGVRQVALVTVPR